MTKGRPIGSVTCSVCDKRVRAADARCCRQCAAYETMLKALREIDPIVFDRCIVLLAGGVVGAATGDEQVKLLERFDDSRRFVERQPSANAPTDH